MNKGTHTDYCKNGHLRTSENTYITTSGHQKCRICQRANQRKCYKDALDENQLSLERIRAETEEERRSR